MYKNWIIVHTFSSCLFLESEKNSKDIEVNAKTRMVPRQEMEL